MYSQRSGPPVFSLGGPAPRDIWALLIGLFVVFVVGTFEAGQAWLGLLRLGRDTLVSGAWWQSATYAVVPPLQPIALVFTLLMIYLFGRDVFLRVGRRRFWILLGLATWLGGVVALLTQFLLGFLPWAWVAEIPAFELIQGTQILLVVLVAAFALLIPDATVYFFFVMAIPARILLWIEIGMLGLAYLVSKDLAGLVGALWAIGVVASLIHRRGPSAWWGNLRARFERWRTLRRFEKKRGKSPLRLVKPDDDRWVN